MIIRLFQYFEPFVTILVVAGILAFVLNYPVEFLQKRHFDRNYAVLLVVLLSIIGLGTLAVTLLPVLLQQLSGIVEQFPDWLSTVDQKLHAF
jgi:predicted PurR-regulated permease PerM